MKIVSMLILLFVGVISLEAVTCGCAIASKDMVRCDYYVKGKLDLTHQKNCIAYADATYEPLPGKAAWYYLLGGDVNKAKESAKKALKLKQQFALEYLAIAFAIEGDYQSANNALKEFKKIVKNSDYIKKDLEDIKKIYKNLDISKLDY